MDVAKSARDQRLLMVSIWASAGFAVLSSVWASSAGLRRATRDGSDLIRAEAAEWLGDTLLSVGVLIGFLFASALVAAGRADLAAHVDPGMVTLVSLAFLWIPIKLIVSPACARFCQWPRRPTCSTSSVPA